MKKILCLIPLLFLTVLAKGQSTILLSNETSTFIPDNTTITSGISGPAGYIVTDVNVRIHIDHTFDGVLDIFLTHNGHTIELSTDNGASGDGYRNTIFDDETSVPIVVGSAPFTGIFRPEQPLSLFDGMLAEGSWVLRIADDASGEVGMLNFWTLELSVISGDSDGDGVPDGQDNCQMLANASQEDMDGDGLGDACDLDIDGDGVENDVDSCPLVPDASQQDLDADGAGDACDDDIDGDGYSNETDRCPMIPHGSQEDLDGDGIGDICDSDADGDGHVNESDNCPLSANESQDDLDLDGLGDVCDRDIDNDGHLNASDNCPFLVNPDQGDMDFNGIGDLCDVGTITLNNMSEILCPASTIEISFEVTGYFSSTNIFSAELSDATGSFENLTVIGTLAGNLSGSISAALPMDLPTGTQYRIRLVASDPGVTSSDNGFDLNVVALPVISVPDYLLVDNNAGKCSALLNLTNHADVSGGSVMFKVAGTVLEPNEANNSVIHEFPFGVTEVLAEVTNACGTVSSAFEVEVKNDAPIIAGVEISQSPKPVNTAIPVKIFFTDSNLIAGSVSWGDGSFSPLSMEGGNEINISHQYIATGVYTVEVLITDACGETDTEIYQYVVVYDPSAGFVTGGGWINSPPGAYLNNPETEGKALFGFVSKYEKGSTTPEGNTNFQFHAGNLDFEATGYEWLVIAGHKAMYKGSGEVNGESGYLFQVSAVDGDKASQIFSDKIRIRIWDSSSGAIIYDNQKGEADDTEATTAIAQGSIVIHEGKSSSSQISSARLSPSTIRIDEAAATQVYPNPFTEKLTFRFYTESNADVKVQIFDITGNVIYSRAHENSPTGIYSVDVSDGISKSGIHILKITQGARTDIIKVLRR